jgi:hypothetical protein
VGPGISIDREVSWDAPHRNQLVDRQQCQTASPDKFGRASNPGCPALRAGSWAHSSIRGRALPHAPSTPICVEAGAQLGIGDLVYIDCMAREDGATAPTKLKRAAMIARLGRYRTVRENYNCEHDVVLCAYG